MRGFWLLVHVLGFTLWLGGGIATMVAGISAKSFAPTERLRSYKLIGAIQRLLVGLGAIAVVGISVPTAAKLGRLETDARGELPEAFQALRKRQILAASIAGGLGLIAMFAATLGKG